MEGGDEKIIGGAGQSAEEDLRRMRLFDGSSLEAYILGRRDEIKALLMDGAYILDISLTRVLSAVRDAEKSGKIDSSASEELIQALSRIPFRRVGIKKHIKSALEISRMGMSAEKSLYLAVAKERGMELVTCDEEIGRAAKTLGIKCIII
jgi:predicted nucleic acid-binding protein